MLILHAVVSSLNRLSRYVKSVSTRKAAESQGLKLARQLAVIRERARADREALEASQGHTDFLPLTSMVFYGEAGTSCCKTHQ